jgi:hypothetical protein
MSVTMKRTLLFSAAPLTLAAMLVVLAAVTAINAQTPGPTAPPPGVGNAPMAPMTGTPMTGGDMAGMNNMCAMAQRHAQNMAEMDRLLNDAQTAATGAKDIGAATKITQARELLHRQQQMMLQTMQSHLQQMQQCVQQMQTQMQAQQGQNQTPGMRNNNMNRGPTGARPGGAGM